MLNEGKTIQERQHSRLDLTEAGITVCKDCGRAIGFRGEGKWWPTGAYGGNCDAGPCHTMHPGPCPSEGCMLEIETQPLPPPEEKSTDKKVLAKELDSPLEL